MIFHPPHLSECADEDSSSPMLMLSESEPESPDKTTTISAAAQTIPIYDSPIMSTTAKSAIPSGSVVPSGSAKAVTTESSFVDPPLSTPSSRPLFPTKSSSSQIHSSNDMVGISYTPTRRQGVIASFSSPALPPRLLSSFSVDAPSSPSVQSQAAVVPSPLDDIVYVDGLDTYFSPGRVHNIGVQLKKNLCSQCGHCKRNNWCPHLRKAGLKAGMKLENLQFI